MRGVGRCANSRRKHQVIVLSPAARSLPYPLLACVMVAQHIDAALGQFEGAAGFPGLGFAASTNRAPDHHERRVVIEVNIRPGDRPEFLGPGRPRLILDTP